MDKRSEYKHQWAIKNRDKVREAQRRYYARNRKKCNESTRRWQYAHWDKFLKTQNRYRKNRYRKDAQYREHTLQHNRAEYLKHRAHYLVYGAKRRKLLQYRAITLLNNARLRGEIVRPSRCESCKRICVPDGHHHRGYSRPLEVIWLCRYCHRAIH